MKTDALDIDADGMPLFRPDPAAAPSRIDVTTALRLMEHQDQLRDLQLQELRRAIQDGLDSGEPVDWNPEAIKAAGSQRLRVQVDSKPGV